MATQSQQMNVIFIPGVNLKQVYQSNSQTLRPQKFTSGMLFKI